MTIKNLPYYIMRWEIIATTDGSMHLSCFFNEALVAQNQPNVEMIPFIIFGTKNN